jgi:hypothetical protein
MTLQHSTPWNFPLKCDQYLYRQVSPEGVYIYEILYKRQSAHENFPERFECHYFQIFNYLSITPPNVTLCDEGESRPSSLAKIALFTAILSFRFIRITKLLFCKEIKAKEYKWPATN